MICFTWLDLLYYLECFRIELAWATTTFNLSIERWSSMILTWLLDLSFPLSSCLFPSSILSSGSSFSLVTFSLGFHFQYSMVDTSLRILEWEQDLGFLPKGASSSTLSRVQTLHHILCLYILRISHELTPFVPNFIEISFSPFFIATLCQTSINFAFVIMVFLVEYCMLLATLPFAEIPNQE